MEYRGMNLNHDFGRFNEPVKRYLRRVYLNSLNYYEEKYCNGNPTNTKELDLYTIDRSICYTEDYLFYFYHLYNDLFLDVFLSLKKNVDKITVLEPERRGIYGQFIPWEKLIYINPSLSGSRTLRKDERTRLYLCHELGHAVHNDWMDTFKHNIDKNRINQEINMAYQGFCLIDEATTQNTAENVAYFYSKSNRPKQGLRRDQLYSGRPFKTNFDFYGNLQEPATLFSKTLRGIGIIDSDDDALNRLSLRAMNNQFLNDIFYEYKRDGQEENLYLLMGFLGIIKRASYATFGYDKKNYIDSSLEAFNEVKKLARSLRDSRPPFRR